LPGTPRYTPAWEKTGNVVSRALGYSEVVEVDNAEKVAIGG